MILSSILRHFTFCPNKLLGVIAMLGALFLLAALPLLTRPKIGRVDFFQECVLDYFFYGVVLSFILLGYLGSMPAVAPYVFMSQIVTIFYFSLFLTVAGAAGAGRYLASFIMPEKYIRKYPRKSTYLMKDHLFMKLTAINDYVLIGLKKTK